MNKNWVTLKTKKEFSITGIPEMVGIYYNPYNKSIQWFINCFILPEFRSQVYGWKHS